jgi:hypothetical protein
MVNNKTLSEPIVNQGFLYVNGLSISYLSPTSISLSPGKARDYSNKDDIILKDTSLVLSTTYAGQNGLDIAPRIGSRSYAVYVIGDSRDYNPTAGIISLDHNAPLLPSGYDMYRRVGWIVTDPSLTILKFFQYGSGETRSYYYNHPNTNILFSGSSTSYFALSLNPFIPPIQTHAYIRVSYTCSDPLNSVSFNPFGSSQTVEGMVRFSGGTVGTEYTQVIVPTQFNTFGNPSILYKVGPNGTADRLNLSLIGYKDYL